MKKLVVLAAILLSAGSATIEAQDQKPENSWKAHGFAEAQYRPPQDFSSLAGWVTVKKEASTVGVFNFSQAVTPVKPEKVSWWQTYTGPFVAKVTKAGYMEGGVAIGAEAGPHLRLAEYAFVAPTKSWGVTVFAIHEHGTYEGSGWTRIQAQKAITKNVKIGYHHQTYIGDGINTDIKLGKTPFSFFGVIARDNGKTKSMAAFRYNF